jgi:hypothetical protein
MESKNIVKNNNGAVEVEVKTGAEVVQTLNAVNTVDTFLNTLPANASLNQFTDSIEKDKGMRNMIPDMGQQVDALRRFAEGKMSYAEMRSLCG